MLTKGHQPKLQECGDDSQADSGDGEKARWLNHSVAQYSALIGHKEREGGLWVPLVSKTSSKCPQREADSRQFRLEGNWKVNAHGGILRSHTSLFLFWHAYDHTEG